MEVVSVVLLDIIKSILAIIKGIRKMPNFLRKLRDMVSSKDNMLRSLYRKSRLYILSGNDLTDWLAEETACKRILRRMEVILGDYVRQIPSRWRLPLDTLFYFGPRKELRELQKDLEESMQSFTNFSERQVEDIGFSPHTHPNEMSSVLSRATLVEALRQRPHSSRQLVPVMGPAQLMMKEQAAAAAKATEMAEAEAKEEIAPWSS